MAVTFDQQQFVTRIQRVYEKWQECDGLSKKVDAFILINGKSDEAYTKTVSVQTWLFGYELQDTAILLTSDAFFILSSRKKIEFVKTLSNLKLKNISFKLITRTAGDKDHESIKKLTEAFSNSGNGNILGLFTKETFGSEFSKECGNALKKKAEECIDVSSFFSAILSIKDEAEINLIKKASEITCTVFSKHLKENIMDVIDEDKKVSHLKLSEGCQDALKNKDLTKGYAIENLEMCYDPIIQSGGNYVLKFSAESDKKILHFGTIICSLGVRYRSYCSNVVRTLIVNPTETIITNYDFLLNLLDWTIEKIKPGLSFQDLYTTVVTKVKSERPDLSEYLTRTIGFITGIEFRDGNQVIGAKTMSVFQLGMSVNLNIGFQNLVDKDADNDKYKTYSLWIGDVVVVGIGENQTNSVLTLSAKRRTKAISLYIEDEEEEEEEANEEDDEEEEEEEEDNSKENSQIALTNGKVKSHTKNSPLNSLKKKSSSDSGKKKNGISESQEMLGRGHRRAIIEQKTRSEQTSEEKRLERRRFLFEQLQTNSRNRLSGLKTDDKLSQRAKSNIAYKGAGQMPKEEDVRKLRIFIDKKYETVILPIFGHPTPFHISTLKNVSSSIEADYTYLRINFHHPGAVIGPKDASSFQSPHSTFLKEMTYRASNQRHHGETSSPSTNLNNAYRIIKEVLKKFRSREAEERERANLVEQDVLVVESGKSAFRLRDLYIRPNIVTKRITGTLEAHSNGFRFTSIRGDKVDILYNNIKHAFYQPCDGEMIILLHFHLKNAIMYGKKKQTDIQFYTEVGELTTDLGKAHSRMQDRDDLEAEHREREMREQIKQAFKTFVDRSESLAKRYNLEFEMPFRELGFFGCPLRSTVLLMPTSGCLISLSEWPPFVINLEEVDFVQFERVSLSIRTFDMVFVFQDYRKKPVMINSIPSTSLDHVKEWVMSVDIYYSEGAKSLNWPKLMKTIVDNPEDFLDQNCWSFISPDDDDDQSDDEDSEMDDANYQPSEASSVSGENESESGSEEDEDEDWDAEEESQSEASLDTDESEGKTWDQLYEEARKDDQKKEAREDDDRLLHAGGGGGIKRHRDHSPLHHNKKSKHSSSSAHKKHHKHH